MNEEKYIKKISSKPIFRVGAWICLVIIGVLVIATLVTGVTGSKYFMGCLFLCIVVPVFMYVVLWLGKVISSSDKKHLTDTKNEIDKK